MSKIACNVLMGTLNPTHSLTHSLFIRSSVCAFAADSRCWPRRVVVHWKRLNWSLLILRVSSATDVSRPTRRSTSSWYVTGFLSCNSRPYNFIFYTWITKCDITEFCFKAAPGYIHCVICNESSNYRDKKCFFFI